MALFTSLSEKMSHIFSKLTKRGKLTELEIKEAMKVNKNFKKVFTKFIEVI